jgi:hypothetical protein
MASVRLEADRWLVLDVVPYSDSGHVAKVLSRTLGVVAVWVRGKGVKSVWHPLSVLEVTGVSRKGSEGLFRYGEVRRVRIPERMTTEAARAAVAFFVAEVLMRILPEQTPHPELHDAAVELAVRLDVDERIGTPHVDFLGTAIGLLGLAPPEPPHPHAGFNLATGEWEERQGGDDGFLAPEVAHAFAERVFTAEPKPLPNALRKPVVLAQLRYLQLHLSGPRTVRSYEVLEAVFSTLAD